MSAREQMDDDRLERLQARIALLETRLARFPFLDGALVEYEAIATGATRVAHRLGRAVRGFIVVSCEPDGAIGLSTTQPNDPKNAVHLEASVACTAALWFW